VEVEYCGTVLLLAADALAAMFYASVVLCLQKYYPECTLDLKN